MIHIVKPHQAQPSDFKQIAEPFRRNQPGACTAALDYGVCRNGGAMYQLLDTAAGDARLMPKLCSGRFSDVGGTFTDLVLVTQDGRLVTRKVLSTSSNYAEAIFADITDLLPTPRRHASSPFMASRLLGADSKARYVYSESAR